MDSHIPTRESERTVMGRWLAMGKRTKAFPDKRTEKIGPPFVTADGWT